jgi:hypothetical protein
MHAVYRAAKFITLAEAVETAPTEGPAWGRKDHRQGKNVNETSTVRRSIAVTIALSGSLRGIVLQFVLRRCQEIQSISEQFLVLPAIRMIDAEDCCPFRAFNQLEKQILLLFCDFEIHIGLPYTPIKADAQSADM